MGMSLEQYKEKIRTFSEQIVEAQRPFRILDAIKWHPLIEADFLANKGKAFPKVDRDYYEHIPLNFDPVKKIHELADIGRAIHKELGSEDDLAQLLMSTVDQYLDVVLMLKSRGTREFYNCSRKLYGSTLDTFFDGKLSIIDQGRHLQEVLSSFEYKFLGQDYPKILTSEEVVVALRERFAHSFLKDKVEVRISDGIVADAAAGSDVIKIREGAMFSKKDIDIFAVHEGFVHVATTQNGKAQRIAKFLSKGPPRTAVTQEGLAILMEILTFSTYPLRARTINDRILGVNKAEEGADFIEVYNFYLEADYDETTAFRNTMRVFRGGVLSGGAPFTKDISYGRGFIENYNFIRTAIRRGNPEVIPFMFAGKLHVDDVPLLYRKHQEGIVDMPALLPPQFQDLNGLAVWMSFSSFLNTINADSVSTYFDQLFNKHF
jgi:uncharacterized protein (TIGR02421 family)